MPPLVLFSVRCLVLPCLLDKGVILLCSGHLLREAFPDATRGLVILAFLAPAGLRSDGVTRANVCSWRAQAVFCSAVSPPPSTGLSTELGKEDYCLKK